MIDGKTRRSRNARVFVDVSRIDSFKFSRERRQQHKEKPDPLSCTYGTILYVASKRLVHEA